MTPQQVHLLRKTFAEVESHGPVAALVFYRRLFELDPSLRPMFKSDIESQAEKLTEMLDALISMLERPAALDSELRLMGARHAGYGVREEHYATVGAALIDMIADVLDDRFTPEVRQAWESLYTVVAERMLAGAASAAVSPPQG